MSNVPFFPLFDLTRSDSKSLHISLSRPIVLRKHEQNTFFAQVSRAIQDTALQPFEIGFSQFACMKSDTSDRVFLTLEVSSGWQELHALSLHLNQLLFNLFRARAYFEDTRFHTSFAYLSDPTRSQAELCQEGMCLAQEWNHDLRETVCQVGPLLVYYIHAQAGNRVERIRVS